jgi:cation diffusion facilitator family transporter
VARKYNSQALEADALHFSTDIWSSAVVLLGLILAQFELYFADSVAALAVALIVLGVSWRLGKKAADMLLDRTPVLLVAQLESLLDKAQGILRYHDLKVRTSGAENFIEVTIHVQPGLTLEKAHEISHEVEKQIIAALPRSYVHVHIEPDKHPPEQEELQPQIEISN